MKAVSNCFFNCCDKKNINNDTIYEPPTIKTHNLSNKKRPVSQKNNRIQNSSFQKHQSKTFKLNSSIQIVTPKNKQILNDGPCTQRVHIKISRQQQNSARQPIINPQVQFRPAQSYINYKKIIRGANFVKKQGGKQQFNTNKAIKQMKQKVNNTNKIILSKTSRNIQRPSNNSAYISLNQNINEISAKKTPINLSPKKIIANSACKASLTHVTIKKPITNSEISIKPHNYLSSKQIEGTAKTTCRTSCRTTDKQKETCSSLSQKLKIIFQSNSVQLKFTQACKNQSTLNSIINPNSEPHNSNNQSKIQSINQKQSFIHKKQQNVYNNPLRQSLRKNPPTLTAIRTMQQGRLSINSIAILNPLNFLFKTKEITPSLLSSHTLEHKIFKAADICSRIFHPNLIRIYYAFYTKSMHLTICTQFTETNLEQVIKKKELQDQPLNQRSIKQILKDILKGLWFMHNFVGVGIVHGNLKPKNILISNGKAKLQWLGYEDSLISPYIAPQIRRGQPSTLKSDIWSVGVIAYELAYGQLPEFLVQQLMSDISSIQLQNKSSILSPITKLQTQKKSRYQNQQNQTLQLPLQSCISNQHKLSSFFDMKQMAESKVISSNESNQKKPIQISQMLKDFIQKTMTDSIYGRMTATQCLAHPFFRDSQQ